MYWKQFKEIKTGTIFLKNDVSLTFQTVTFHICIMMPYLYLKIISKFTGREETLLS